MKLYHFSGAGNNFVVLDGREADMTPFRSPERIVALCTQYHTDGLMILGSASSSHDLSVEAPDFRMEFYNPDGSGGMMCGNGGRCIAAFADYLGIRPGDGSRIFRFLAPDGPHTAELLARDAKGWTIRLGMKDVSGVTPVLGGYFLDTGTQHYVRFVDDVEALDIEKEGPRYRHDPAFAPIGANANFVQRLPGGGIKVRTFEKGVEGETLACGTGITASAIAAYLVGTVADSRGGVVEQGTPSICRALFSCPAKLGSPARREESATGPVRYDIQARIDRLAVDFRPEGDHFTDVYLTGPADEIR